MALRVTYLLTPACRFHEFPTDIDFSNCSTFHESKRYTTLTFTFCQTRVFVNSTWWMSMTWRLHMMRAFAKIMLAYCGGGQYPLFLYKTLRHNGLDGVLNDQPHHCLLSRLFGRRPKKTSKLCVTGLRAGNSPGTGEFPAQMTSNAENASIWWRHHEAVHARPSLPGTLVPWLFGGGGGGIRALLCLIECYDN